MAKQDKKIAAVKNPEKELKKEVKTTQGNKELLEKEKKAAQTPEKVVNNGNNVVKENQQQNKPKHPIQPIRGMINNYAKQISSFLELHNKLDFKRFFSMIDNYLLSNRELWDTTPNSLMAAIITAAQFGLPLDNINGFAFILPYKDKNGNKHARYQLGYQGKLEIILSNPLVKDVITNIVKENDEFVFELYPPQIIKHTAPLGNRGEIKGVYAVIIINDGDKEYRKVVIIDKDELKAIQKLSPSGDKNNSAYNNGTDIFNWMQKKVAIGQVYKLMPKYNMPQYLQEAMKYDEIAESGGTITVTADGRREIKFNTEQENNTNKKEDGLFSNVEVLDDILDE